MKGVLAAKTKRLSHNEALFDFYFLISLVVIGSGNDSTGSLGNREEKDRV